MKGKKKSGKRGKRKVKVGGNVGRCYVIITDVYTAPSFRRRKNETKRNVTKRRVRL